MSDSCFAANAVVEFGGIVSTSNTYASDTVNILCNNHLLWSMATVSDTSVEFE